MKVVMSGGGTGGHIYPAIAIAETIKANYPDAEIIFTGNPQGLESKITTEAGYRFYPIECRGLVRSLSLRNIKSAYLAVFSPMKAKKLLREFKPDIVIGTGGYVCWPTLKAASDLGIHSAIHESNSVPGLAVKMLSGRVERIWTNYEETIKAIGHPEKSVRVGNPLRNKFTTVSPEEAKKQIGGGRHYDTYIMSVGGSGGAERLNECALELMRDYIAKRPDIFYVHITGRRDYENTRKRFAEAGLDKYQNIRLLDYTDSMPCYMAAADIVISRAGALTLSELALMSKAAILIPSPNVTNNHQYCNSKVLADNDAAVMIEEKNLLPGVIVEKTDKLVGDPLMRRKLSRNIKTFAYEDSNERILEEIVSMTGIAPTKNYGK